MMCRRWAGTRRLRSGGSQPPSPATREIMMGVGDGVASVIVLTLQLSPAPMLTFTSEPCPHADG